MSRPAPNLVAIDGHVHLHDREGAIRTLQQAQSNFASAAPAGATAAVMLAERAGFDVFESIRSQLHATAEAGSLWFDRECRLLVLAGRQIVTAEGLEILALATTLHLDDGLPADRVLDRLAATEALVVLPWGAGKWFGARGRSLDRLLAKRGNQILLGDNRGRPALWHVRRFSQDRLVLAGSDSLPLPGSEREIGRFGSVIGAVLPVDKPASALRAALLGHRGPLVTFGRPIGPVDFLIEQLRLRMPR